jgi:hypothetical protein
VLAASEYGTHIRRREALRRLAKDYQDRAAPLKEGPSFSNPEMPSQVARQPQQPQIDHTPAAPMGLRDDAQHWRRHAERLRARAAQLTDDGGRLAMLRIAETY